MKRLAPFLIVALCFVVVSVVVAHAKAVGVGGVIEIDCAFSHTNFDDAIVHPGEHDSTHQHGYVGADNADGLSTVDSMEHATSSCAVASDTSGYWFPLLIDPAGRVYFPTKVLVYYNSPKAVSVQIPPEGLQMLAGGDTLADPAHFFYTCGGDAVKHYVSPPNCTKSGRPVGSVAAVFFPNCLSPDGAQTYAASHCPAGTMQIPSIHYNIRYAKGLGGPGWGLTSDAMKGMTDGRSLHADFWQTWSDQGALADLIARCDNAHRDCKHVSASVPASREAPAEVEK